MKIKRFEPSCNLVTLKDGRGSIYQWVPDKPIMEWTHQTIIKGKLRGNHYHPEFDEYILLVSGQGAIIEKGDKEDHFLRMSKGMCVYIPRNTSHVFLATTDCESVSFLTKPWNDCKNPIIHENLGHGKGDFGDPDSVHHDEQHLEAFSEDK